MDVSLVKAGVWSFVPCFIPGSPQGSVHTEDTAENSPEHNLELPGLCTALGTRTAHPQAGLGVGPPVQVYQV